MRLLVAMQVLLLTFSSGSFSLGGAVTYAQSATVGDTFTINTSGIYTITVNTQTSSAAGGQYTFITRNATATTLNTGLTDSTTLALFGNASNETNASFSGYLAANDVVRVHTNNFGQGASTIQNASRNNFFISFIVGQ